MVSLFTGFSPSSEIIWQLVDVMGIAGVSAALAEYQSRRRPPGIPRCNWDAPHARGCRAHAPDGTDRA